MKELDKCLILGRESIDANTLNRCFFNLFKNMGELNSSFVNASSENVPWSPYFSGGYQNALNDIDYVKNLNPCSASYTSEGLVPRLYRGYNTEGTLFSNDGLVTESVTGSYMYDSNTISTFATTVDFMTENESPSILKSFITDETKFVSSTKTLGGTYNPTVKKTGFVLCGKLGVSFGTITFSKNRGAVQKNEIELNIKSDLIDIKGADKILFFTIGNGLASGVKTISEDGDMITDVGDCNISYNSENDVVISNITKGDSSDKIVIDDATGRILDEDEEYDYDKCTILTNNTYTISFLVFFKIKDRILEYSDNLWCFYLVDSADTGRSVYYDATGYAENYYSCTFDNFEAVDDGKNGNDGSHIIWDTADDNIGGCTTMASDAFNGCYSATFKSLCWFSPRLRYADRMFKNCRAATFDSIPQNLKFGSLKNGKQMFFDCINAKFSTIKNISIPLASDVQSMFEGCASALFASLSELNLHGTCSRMFYDDVKATFASLTQINSAANKMESMFENCDSALFDNLSEILLSYSGEVNTNKMFYCLEHPKFDKLVKIKTQNDTTYDGTSMFEGCTNSTFESLTGIGDVVIGKRMFMNLDKLDETIDSGRARFEKLVNLGTKLEDGTEMFCNDRFLVMNLDSTQLSIPIKNGTSMFEQVSSITINGDMNKLNKAEYMFSNVVSAIIHGNMNSLVNGDNMFFNCTSACIDGTMNELQSMYSMCLSASDVYMKEIPSKAMNMQSSFACIDNSCVIENWLGSDVGYNRSCIQTFENSNGVSISGNILRGNINDTSRMFANCTNLVLCNPQMETASDNSLKYFSVDSSLNSNNFALMRGFDRDDGSAMLTFVGSCESIDKVGLYVGKDNAENGMLMFETITADKTTFDIYSTSNAHQVQSQENLYDIYYSIPKRVTGNETINVYRITDDGEQGELYGTVSISGNTTGNIAVKMYKDGSTDVVFAQTITNSGDSLDDLTEPDSSESIETVVKNYSMSDMTTVWEDATDMFHNVVQSDLLSGYHLFFSNSLRITDGMFRLDNKSDLDETFRNAGPLFYLMSKSNSLTSMNAMFMNRRISNSKIFTDANTEGHVSFCIPNSIVNAASAYKNCTIVDDDIKFVYLKIPSSLVYADEMFNNYDGPNIHFDYDNTSVIYLNDNISCNKIFNGCRFSHDDGQVYGMSVPSVYLNIFEGSDFSMDNICNLEIRGYKNFAYPYSNDDFFYNDANILGCSDGGVSFKSMTGDITDLFNEKSTTTDSGISVECAYLATIIGPVNTKTENYEILTAYRSGDKWSVRMSDTSQFSDDMYTDMVVSTNNFLMDSVLSLSGLENRMTCMFSPNLLFAYGSTMLGDRLAYISNPDKYDSFGKALVSNYGVCYNNITLKYLENIDAKEMPFAFFGLTNASFERVTTIGTNAMVGYGAFMGCKNATFDSLSAVEINQPESMSVFYSRFADTDKEKKYWVGNYSNMFRDDNKASFAKLKNISLNVQTALTPTNDKFVSAWVDSDGSLIYIYDGLTRRITIDKTVADGVSTYRIIIYNYSGDRLNYYNTNIESGPNSNFKYDICLLDKKLSIVITIFDKYNNMLYFVVTDTNIKQNTAHPSFGYANYDKEQGAVLRQFKTDEGYTESEIKTSDGNTYIAKSGISTLETEDQYYITFVNKGEYEDSAIIKFGSPFTKIKAVEDDRNLWYLMFEYIGNDGIKYISISLFYSDRKPDLTAMDYGDFYISYRLSKQNNNQIIEEAPYIPGTVDYIHLIDLETSSSTIGRNCGFFSGMFKNCSSASFESLSSIIIPTSGSCAEMFANCTAANFKNNISTFILPISYKKNDESITFEDDWKCYHRMFAGISTDCLNLENLSIENTNVSTIGKNIDSKGHHNIGEHLFDGMIVDGIVKEYPNKPFTYQDAIYSLKLDSDIANNIFDRNDKIFTITYYDIFGKKIKRIVVEANPTTYEDEYISSYPTRIPTPPKLEGYTFKYWSLVDSDGEPLGLIYPETDKYILTCEEVIAKANYGGNDGYPIVAVSENDDKLPILTENDNRLVTSFRTDYQNATQIVVTIPSDGNRYDISGIQWIDDTNEQDKYVSWGDGASSIVEGDGTAYHIYSKAGIYTVSISEYATTFYAKSGKIIEDNMVTDIVRFGKNIKNLDYAFYKCNKLSVTSIPIWPVELISANYMFYDCTNINVVSIPDMDMCKNLTSVQGMFYGCSSMILTQIPKLPNSVENMEFMFKDCSSITPPINKWPLNLVNANGTYQNCVGITGAWTDVSEELMPSTIKNHLNTVDGASDTIRNMFTHDWGGSI